MKKQLLILVISGIILFSLTPFIFIFNHVFPYPLMIILTVLSLVGFVEIIAFLMILASRRGVYVGSKNEVDILLNDNEILTKTLKENLIKNDFHVVDTELKQTVFKQNEKENYYLSVNSNELQAVFNYFDSLAYLKPAIIILLDNYNVSDDFTVNSEEINIYYFLEMDYSKKKCKLITMPLYYQNRHRKIVLKLFNNILALKPILD